MAGFAQPELAGGAQVEPVVAAVDLKGGGEPSRATREIEKPSGLAVPLHDRDSVERFEGADENRGRNTSGFADDIEHEVRAIVEKNVDVAWSEIHRANPRCWAAKMVSGGVARRIGFCLHDAAAKAARREIVNDDLSDEEACEFDGIAWKFGAAEAAKIEFL
jgi:hypothetical protein